MNKSIISLILPQIISVSNTSLVSDGAQLILSALSNDSFR